MCDPLSPLGPRADFVALIHRHDKNPTVASLAGSRGCGDRANRFINNLVWHDGVTFHFRQEADAVLLAAINGGVALSGGDGRELL